MRRFEGGLLRTIVLLALLLVPGIFYVVIPLQWEARNATHVTGDEPHYLIVADAIAHEHSLDVSAAYQRDARTAAIFGPIDWENHTRTGPGGTFSLHGVGLPTLLAPAFATFGVRGARVVLSLLTTLVPFLFFAIARQFGIGVWSAAALSVCSAFSLPFLAASGQVFPDLPAGVALLALSAILIAVTNRADSLGLFLTAGVLLSMLPWLHVKNVLPALVFAVAFVVAAVRGQPRIPAVRRASQILLPFLLSLTALGVYNSIAFGSISGPYSSTDAGATTGQAAMIALGLHLDQAQGILIQQPLFLLALAGLPFLFLRRPFVAWTCLAAYAAVILPNAFHPCWYGCGSFSGRFMWSVAALWFLPLATLFHELRPRERIAAACVGGLAMWWQIALMLSWKADPGALYTRLTEDFGQRNSLVAPAWRRYLPSFYDFDRFATQPMNLLAIATVATLLAAGMWMAVTRRRRTDSALGWILPQLLAIVGVAGVSTFVVHAKTTASIDLLDRFASAELKPLGADSRTFALSHQTVDGQTRAALFAHPPSRITWKLKVPRDARFETWIGLDSTAWIAEGDGVLFRMGVATENGYREWITRRLDPRVLADRQWIPISVDLSRYGGEDVSIILNTNTGWPDVGDDRNDLAYWVAPRIRTY